MNTILFDSPFCQLVTMALTQVLWQGCVLAVITMICGRGMRQQSAQLRYGLYGAALLITTAALPVNFWLLSASSSFPGNADQAMKSLPTYETAPAAASGLPPSVKRGLPSGNPLPVGPRPAGVTAEAEPVRALPHTVEAVTNDWSTWHRVIAALYFIGLVCTGLRLAAGLIGIRRLCAGCPPLAQPA